jgi:ribonuclease VapC
MADLTRLAGLSLGDGVCLALGQHTGQIALTADRAWLGVAEAVGVRVELVR